MVKNKNAEVIPIRPDIDQLPPPVRPRATRRAGIVRVVGATVALGLMGGAAYGANEFASNQRDRNAAADAEYEQSRKQSEAENIKREAEAQHELDLEVAAFLTSLQEGMSDGSVMSESGSLIIDRGVRVRETPVEDGYADGSRVAYVTDKVTVIPNAIFFNGNILLVNSSEDEPLTKEDGTLNPKAIQYMSTSVIGQIDNTTHRPYIEKVPGPQLPAGDRLSTDERGFVLVGQDGAMRAVSSASTFETIAEAKQAIGS